MSYKANTNTKTVDFVEWSDDHDADLSYLDQPEFSDVDPDSIRSVEFVAVHVEHPYSEQEWHDILDSLCGVDLDVSDPVFIGRVFSREQADRLLANDEMGAYQHSLTVEALSVEVL